jgi:GNAT superfamily N-acetyltransferase
MAEFDALPVVLLDHRERRVAEALVGLQRASYRVEAQLIGDDAIPPLHESVDALALDLTFLAITERDGEPVATLGYQVADGVLDIDRLAVHPRRLRHGLGRRLVEAVLERVPHERAVVSTGQGNHPARRLYERVGYLDDLAATPTLVVSRYERVAVGASPTAVDASSRWPDKPRRPWATPRPGRRGSRARRASPLGSWCRRASRCAAGRSRRRRADDHRGQASPVGSGLP